MEEVYPEEVGPLIDSALRHRARMNLEAMAIAASPHITQDRREVMHKRWERVAYPEKASETAFDPASILKAGIPGMAISPDLKKHLMGIKSEKA